MSVINRPVLIFGLVTRISKKSKKAIDKNTKVLYSR